MTIADEARDSAIHFEGIKYAYRQTRDGIVVSFVVQPYDVPDALSTSRIGARYIIALVELDDNEQPKPKPAKEKSKPTATKSPAQPQPIPPAGAKWRELPPAQQAGIRINEPTFAAYLREEHPDEWHETGEADACLKFICKIESKRGLAHNHKALTLWHQLDTEYRAWLARERVGA